MEISEKLDISKEKMYNKVNLNMKKDGRCNKQLSDFSRKRIYPKNVE